MPRRRLSFRTRQVGHTIVIILRWFCWSCDGQRFENRSASEHDGSSARRFGLAGALAFGPAVEFQLARRARGVKASSGEWAVAAAIRGLSFGTAGWLTVGRNFGIAFGILSAFAMHISYKFGLGTNTYRIYQKPQLERRLVGGGIVRGGLIGIAGVVGGALTGRSEAFLYGVQIGIVTGILNTAITILSPPVEWWVDNLPDRALVSCLSSLSNLIRERRDKKASSSCRSCQ